MQEFSFTRSCTKAFINRVFNSHFYGSVLWNLYEKESSMVFNTWSTSVRKMFRLNRRSHRYLIEPISEMPHIKQALIQRSVGFMKRLSSSRKDVLRKTFEICKKDCRTTTGSNIRNIMLESKVNSFEQLSKTDLKMLKFHPAPQEDQWRIPLIKDLVDIRDGISDVIGWSKDELEASLDFLCTK